MTSLQVFYEGNVQGVGFRWTVRDAAKGFDVTGWVRNLPDGRVELTAEGSRAELDDFGRAIQDSELSHFIQQEQVEWSPAKNEFRGFDIVR